MISLSEAKAQLNLTHDEDDTLIDSLISAVTKVCEHQTHRAITVTTKVETLDTFSTWIIELPVAPFVSITSVRYDDADEVEQTLVEGTDFTLDTRNLKAKIYPIYGGAWPSTHPKPQSVRITYQVGYSTVPDDLKQAALMLLSSLYEQREAHVDHTQVPVPFGVELLLGPYRVPSL